jgi:ATP-dependent DNA helicase RecG
MQNLKNNEILRLPVTQVRGIGSWHARHLKQLGIETIEDLLRHFPLRYEDFTNIKKISAIKVGEICTVFATVKKISVRRTWKKKMFLTEAILDDGSGVVRAVWFNQPFLKKNIPQNAQVSISGKIDTNEEGLYFSNPSYEIITGKEIRNFRHTGGLVPIYPETQGITSRMLRYYIQPLLEHITHLQDYLPQELLRRVGLMDFQTAIREIHFPSSIENAKRAKRRFAFEDVFWVQLLFQKERLRLAKTLRAPIIPINIPLVKRFVSSLPFKLTDAQRRAAWEILQDMARQVPMNRLLNGDVGSGKTVVATIACLEVVEAGYQAAMLVPTEILARQHFQKIAKMLEKFGIRVCLCISSQTLCAEEQLSGSVPKETLHERISSGAPMLVIGTHALLEERVRFGKLGLVVVDEQHRFGVKQRAKLTKTGTLTPHLLSMTATPIPRTLALGLYGDLDISILDELPKGRQKIITRIIPPASRHRAYKFIRAEIEKGHQAFVICPRIDPEKHQKESAEEFIAESSDWNIEVKAVKTEFEKLSKSIFPDLRVAMLHGRMKSEEKESIMTRFANGAIDILISTSVVEVGVDVPNATVMMIDGAEHFGLAQLHQFRGRVGRGPHQSYCLLFTESNRKNAKRRLEALVECYNGFELAEKDLQIRGPGQFFGTRQSGLPDLAMQSLTDLALVELARREAIALLQRDPELKTAPLLKARLAEFENEVHLE